MSSSLQHLTMFAAERCNSLKWHAPPCDRLIRQLRKLKK